MSSLKRINKFQNLDLKAAFGWFWGIMLLLDLFAYLLSKNPLSVFGGINIGIHLNDSELSAVSIAGANLVSMFIFFIVYSYEMYYEYFPMALTFSITRKDFYKSIILDNIKLIFMFSVIQSVLMKLDIYIMRSIDKTPMVDFKIFNTETDNILWITLSIFIAFLSINSIFNLFAAINYKLGYKFWIVIGFVTGLSFVFLGSYLIMGSFYNLIDWILTTKVDILQFALLISLTFIMYIVGYIIVRNTNINNKTI